MDEITIRPYREGDEVSINQAFNEVFSLNRSIEEWYWKFGKNADSSRIMIALDSRGEVVSHFSMVFIDMEIDGRGLRLAQCLDVFSLDRPELLEKRIFIKTALRFYEEYCKGPGEIPFYYAAPGLKMLRLSKLVLNTKGHIPIDYYSRETSPLIRPLGMITGNSVWNKLASSTKVSMDDVDDLWNCSKIRYPVTLKKNGTYLKKRYLTHPVNKYMFIPAYEDKILRGLAVLSYKERVVKWIDLIWDGNNPDTVSYLFDEVWNVTQKTGAIKLEMWLNNDPASTNILKSKGMIGKRNPYEFHIAACSFDESLDPEDIARRFSLTMGDSDIF